MVKRKDNDTGKRMNRIRKLRLDLVRNIFERSFSTFNVEVEILKYFISNIRITKIFKNCKISIEMFFLINFNYEENP